MNSENRHIDINEEAIVKNKKRGDILYYSISQVAALLDEDERNILYYTNVFDNILKIEISDKKLRYTTRDIDKLEFLINLKNKGMTIKEIQSYCKELPLNIEDLVNIKENNSISISEIISTILESENEKYDNLKEYLTTKIHENNELSVEKIVDALMQEQTKQLNILRENILDEIKEYIDYKFNVECKNNENLYSELSEKITKLASEKNSLEHTIKSQLKEFNEISISRDNNLIAEIKRFKNVIEQAYYIQKEMETQPRKISFIERLFGVTH
ncbi:MerR family transcriptional regulator [Clostridium sp.]|uniref:helix-turn-helix domain-containing protein n=1 Tax=Clostridium sp. TaxID=1506 RepID=UPI00262B766F|nr:MerR family transcriptional regulator [Clostridium sp.]